MIKFEKLTETGMMGLYPLLTAEGKFEYDTFSSAAKLENTYAGESYLITYDGVPSAAFGFLPQCFMTSSYMIWFIGTIEIKRHKIAFFRESKKLLQLIRGRDMCCYVRADFYKSRCWLQWLGFKITGTASYAGVDLIRMELK